MLTTGAWKARRLGGFELTRDGKIADSCSSERLTATLRNQACGHAAKNAQVHGHQRTELSGTAAVGTRTSAGSSDFAQPKARLFVVGSNERS